MESTGTFRGSVLPNSGATRFLAKPSERLWKTSAAKEIGGKRVSPRDSEFGETLGLGKSLAWLDTWLGRKSSWGSARPYGSRQTQQEETEETEKADGTLFSSVCSCPYDIAKPSPSGFQQEETEETEKAEGTLFPLFAPVLR
jgi:hypothetical protein